MRNGLFKRVGVHSMSNYFSFGDDDDKQLVKGLQLHTLFISSGDHHALNKLLARCVNGKCNQN